MEMEMEINDEQEKRELEALAEFEDRQIRKIHPDGKFDNAGRWYPSDDEWCPCCNSVRSPSRAYPYNYMVHCRTLGHVANLYSVSEKRLRALRRGRVARKKRESESQPVYKLVAVVGEGRLMSIFDGVTEYHIGQSLRQTAQQNHGGGYYFYTTEEKARNAVFPENAALREFPRVVLKMVAKGKRIKYENGKVSASQVTPCGVVL